MEKQTFGEWHAELKRLAVLHGLGYLIPSVEDYPKDGYDDDLSPSDELSEQFSAAVD